MRKLNYRDSLFCEELRRVIDERDPKSHHGRVSDTDRGQTFSNFEKQVGERIKKYRELEGLTQTQLADAVGLVQPQISNYERCLDRPSVYRLWRIARALNVTMNDMVGDHGR